MYSKTQKRPTSLLLILSQTFSMILGKGKFLHANAPGLKFLLFLLARQCRFSGSEWSSGHITILKKLNNWCDERDQMPRVFLSMPSISLAPVSATFGSSLVENPRRGKAVSFLNLRPWGRGAGVCAAMGTAEEF